MIVTMGTFMHIIYLTVMVLPVSSLCKGSSSMDDDKIYYYNDSVMLPLESYCFVNEHTIRIKESNVLLNVINNTGDWIIATNTTNMFTAFINSSNINNNCSTDNEATSYQFDTALYIIQVIVCIIGIIIAVANISMHFIFKELQTVSGILIIIFCICSCIGYLIAVTHITIYSYHINIPARYCTLFINYISVSNAITYEVTRTTILIHLAYTMYRSYKALGGEENKRTLLCKYITFIIVASLVSNAIVITVDATTNRNAFDTTAERCLYLFDNFESKERILSVVSHVAIFLIWLLMQVILVTIIFVLYILTTRQCCATSSTSRDLRVSLVLMATADLSLIFFVALLLSHTSMHIVALVPLSIAAIEQFILFALFASSSKVVHCCRWCIKEGGCYSAYST